MMALRCLLVFVLFSTSMVAQGQWKIVQSGLPLGRVVAATHVSGSSWIACGLGGISKTEDDGRTWAMISDTSIRSVLDVAFSDGMNGIAVGDSIYHTTNGGWNWSVVRKPETPDSLLPTLSHVVWFNALEGLVATNYSIFLRTSDGGVSWVRRSLPSEFGSRIRDVGVVSESRAFIHTSLGMVITEDKGHTWTFSTDTIDMDGPLSYSIRGQGVAFPLDGSRTVICRYTSDAGSTWHHATTADSTADPFVHAVISGPRFALAISAIGHVYTSRDGGASWKFTGIASDGRQPRYTGISCREDGTGFIFCDDGAIYRIENYGSRIIPVGRPPRTESRSIAMPDSNTILIGGYKTIVRSTDRGKTWITGTPSTLFNVRSVACANSKLMLCTATGPELRRSTDGGITWELATVPARHQLDMAYFVNESIAIVVGESGWIIRSTDEGVTWTEVQARGPGNLYGVALDAAGRLHAVGRKGLICWSSDQGATWNTTKLDSTQDLESVAFDKRGNGIIVSGQGSVYRTSNNGDTWTFMFNDITTPLRQVACRSDANFVTGGSTAGFAGVILTTSDAGLTWDRTVYVRQRMRDITFATPKHGVWISEEDGLFMFSGTDTTVSSVADPGAASGVEHEPRVWFDASRSVVSVDLRSDTPYVTSVALWDMGGRMVACKSGKPELDLDVCAVGSGPYFVSIETHAGVTWHSVLITP